MELSRAILEAEEKADEAGGGRPLTGRVMRFKEDTDVISFDEPPKTLSDVEEAEKNTRVEKGTEVQILEVFTADIVLTSLPLGHEEGHCALVEWSVLEEVR